MPVGHQIAGAFPAANVARRNRPGRAGQVAFAGEKFEIDRRAEEGVTIHPLLNFLELLDRHFAGQEEIFRLQVEPFDHVLLGGVVFVTGRDGVTIHAEIGKIIEHLLDLLHVGFFVDGRVGRHLIAEHLRHLDRENAFLEDAFALHDQIVRPLEAIEVHVPVHPVGRTDGWLCRIFRSLRTSAASFSVTNPAVEQRGDFFFDKFRTRRKLRGHPLAHLFAHEHGVRADVNDPALCEQSCHQRLDLRIDQRFAAADGDHRRVALLGRPQAILQAHHVLEGRGIFANPPAARAGEVAGVQRFELQHRGEFLRAAQLMPDHVGRDFCCERERKSHWSEDSNRSSQCVNDTSRRPQPDSTATWPLDLHRTEF